MPRQTDVVLEDILNAIALLDSELAGHSEVSFARTLFVQRGAERTLEIISEAVRHLPDDLLALRPDISWTDIRSIGNTIRHEYRCVDPALIWSIARNDLPPLRAAVEDLVRRFNP
ncbi:MAG: DUF86 domain-containing protein [Beijerinckiaceae bacterium]|nr:DUF86 domain-containing protein [Beijerinckiaceae bacterium]